MLVGRKRTDDILIKCNGDVRSRYRCRRGKSIIISYSECGSVAFRRDKVTGEWRRLHNEELNDLYCSPNIVRVIKWRRMGWAGHVACMGAERGSV